MNYQPKAPLREFLEIPYEQLEEYNLQSLQYQIDWVPMEKVEAERRSYLEKEKRIKAKKNRGAVKANRGKVDW